MTGDLRAKRGERGVLLEPLDERSFRTSRKMPRLPRLAHNEPVMQDTEQL